MIGCGTWLIFAIFTRGPQREFLRCTETLVTPQIFLAISAITRFTHIFSLDAGSDVFIRLLLAEETWSTERVFQVKGRIDVRPTGISLLAERSALGLFFLSGTAAGDRLVVSLLAFLSTLAEAPDGSTGPERLEIVWVWNDGFFLAA
jgi:hypothetical protein